MHDFAIGPAVYGKRFGTQFKQYNFISFNLLNPDHPIFSNTLTKIIQHQAIICFSLNKPQAGLFRMMKMRAQLKTQRQIIIEFKTF